MPLVIALDIGGTKIEGVLFDDKFNQLKKRRIYFEKKQSESIVGISRRAALKMIGDLVVELKKGKRIKGIGISIPDVISSDGSIVGTSKLSSLSNFRLGRHLTSRFRCAVKVVNDADAFALGEARLGAGKGYENVIGIIYGTGIGAGIIINHRLYAGTTGSCGEFGHNVVNPSGPKERLGLPGTVEAYAAGPNLVGNYVRAGGKIKNPDPKKIFQAKEKTAKRILDESLEHFAIGIAGVMNTLNPGIIVLGGGLSNLPVYRELNRRTKKYTIDGMRKHVKIVKNRLGDSAGIYGAAVLVFGK